MDLGLTNRTVIVTGASGGIGRHIAHGFAAEGADVVITYRTSPSDAEQVAKEIGGRTLVTEYDMSDPAAAGALAQRVLDWTGRIDVLVNNAVNWGASGLPQGPFEAAPEDYWLPVLRDNIEGTLRLTRAVAPILRQRRWGRVVHVSSSVAEDGMPGGEYYGAAKAALHGFSKSAAIGLGGTGDILSNVVMPGLTRTDRNSQITDAVGEHYRALTPIGRLLDASEVANTIVYLGSAANTGITGQVIRVTGGA
ncbi:beta-ketoacyl-ACP reductase [Rhizocola hellebori]|uniref:Beta-ketoacyl-ACP reductase n=1 Tax=Rhizocola hellebori TaxID=1392758 RepID=A0A8J3Q5Q6_9ACTN|nr:SDR family NAD(P)-dependent oxidoreductase [Rhizocola hellebori]GIH03904.1 beta-ketoacyl-ACP reductase [Rhizocola hellebori]